MEQILIEGLKQALARGQSLQQAMESFFYAGYPKQEIEKAARAIQGVQINPILKPKAPVKPLIAKKKQAPVQKVSNYPAKQVVKPKPQLKQPVKPQKVSEYKRQKTKPGLDWILALMLLGLFSLVGALLFMLLK